MLDYWKEIQPALYDDNVVRNTTTGIGDLKTILLGYGYNNSEHLKDLAELLRDPGTNKFLPSPGRINARLKDYFLIMGVAISNISGRLAPRSKLKNDRKHEYTAHWVVVENIEVTGRHYNVDPYFHTAGSGGWVTLYNPFPNTWEGYSYKEFVRAVDDTGLQGWVGLWVKRNIVPVFERHEESPRPQSGSAGGRSAGTPASTNSRRRNNNPLSEELQKRLQDDLKISAISSEVTDLIYKHTGADAAAAVALTRTLRDTRLLVFDNQGGLRMKKPGLGFKTGDNSTGQNAGNVSQAQAEDPSPGSELTQKIANTILPLITSRILQDLEGRKMSGSRNNRFELK